MSAQAFVAGSNRHPGPAAQRGAALVVAILVLGITTVLAISAVRLTNIERRSGTNEETRVASFQFAQSITDAVMANPDNTPVFGGVGYTICTTNIATLEGCNASPLILPDNYLTALTSAGQVTGKVVRAAPEFSNAPRSASLGSSLTNFSAAKFDVVGEINRSNEGQGRERVAQGMILVFPRN